MASGNDGWSGELLYRLHTSGGGSLNWRQVVEHTGLTLAKCRHRVRKHVENLKIRGDVRKERSFCGIPASALVNALRRGPLSYQQLSAVFDRSEVTMRQVTADMIANGYSVVRDQRKVVLPDTPAVDFEPEPLFRSGDTVDISFGVVSDTHGGSHFEQVTALQDFCHIAQEEFGIKHILHPGDAFAGRGVYRGQDSEVYAVNGCDQADAVACNLPEGFTWWLLGGNHDYSFYRGSGLDVRHELRRIGRDDIKLLPYDVADVPLLPGIDARLWHPSGGAPYALSYRGQKGAAQIAQDELMRVVMGDKTKPTIRLLIIGHLHVQYMFDHGPMVVIGAGCFEGQNGYLKRKPLVPHIGAWILQCRFVDGMLHRITPVRFRYREIEDDWRPYWSRRQAERVDVEKMEPIFSLLS
jgi:predicted phosphodiesterase